MRIAVTFQSKYLCPEKLRIRSDDDFWKKNKRVDILINGRF
jgi:hypothetical protein